MSITLTIKNVPEPIAQRLRKRASRNHRSLQGELMAILEHAATSEAPLAAGEVLAQVQRLGLSTPSESATIIRNERDAR